MALKARHTAVSVQSNPAKPDYCRMDYSPCSEEISFSSLFFTR
jgi:hypothetical protein